MYRLTIVSLIYLLLPSLFFLVSWVEPNVSIISIAVLIGSFFYALAAIRNYPKDEFEPVGNLLVFNSFFFAMILCLFSEFGIMAYKSHDHLLHNYKYYLLTTQNLPLFDEKYGINMCYYLGFYIVPAVLGKLFGLNSVIYLSFLWIWLGVGLSFVWMQIMLRRSGVPERFLSRGIWCFLILSGSYVSIILPLYDFFLADPFVQNNSIFINSSFVLNQVPIFTRGLSESTQHALPSILGASILINLLKYRATLFASVIVLFSTFFWSPFSTIGLFVFVLVALVKEIFFAGNKRFALELIAFCVIMLIAFAPVMLFLISSESTDMASNKFIWQSGSGNWLFYYLLYLFSFWGIWFVLIGGKLIAVDSELLWICSGIFVILGLLQMGYYNDLNIRSTISAQVILSLCIVVTFLKSIAERGRSYLFAFAFFLINSLSVWKFYYERFFILPGQSQINSIEHPMNQVFGDNFYDNLKYAYPKNGEEVVKQYSLKEGSVFEKYMLKKNRITE